MTKMLNEALRLLRAGYSVVPVVQGDYKGTPKGVKWTHLKSRRLTEDEATELWTEHPDAGIGLIMGPVSGNVECVDIDDPLIAENCFQLAGPTYMEWTRHGGLHMFVRVRKPFGKDVTRYADHVDVKATGLVKIAPSEGYTPTDDSLADSELFEVDDIETFITDYLHLTPTNRARGNTPPDPNWRPEEVGDRRTRTLAMLGLLRRYGADEETLRNWLLFQDGERVPAPAEPLGAQEREEVLQSVLKYTPELPQVLNPVDQTRDSEADIWVDATDVEETKPRLSFDGRISIGSIIPVIGPSNSGKSFALTALAALATSGRPWPGGGESLQGDWLFISSEEDIASVILPRLHRWGADLKRIHFKRLGAHVSFDGDLTWLEKALDRWPETRFIFVDPIMGFLDTDDAALFNRATRRMLGRVTEIVAPRDVTMFGLIHLNKNTESDPLTRIQGASAFREYARSIWAFVEDADYNADRSNPDLRFYLGHVKAQLGRKAATLQLRMCGPETEGWVEWDGPAEVDVLQDIIDQSQAKARRGSAPDRTKTAEVEAYLHEKLADHDWHEQNSVEAELRARGIGISTINSVKRAMGVKSQKIGSVWYWRLPPDEDEGELPMTA
jgi:hypothetical protein